MKFFSSKRNKVEDLLTEYRKLVVDCVKELHALLADYKEDLSREDINERIKKVSMLEGQADNIRREVQVLLYREALFPDSRGDILGLLESIDRLANGAESAAYMIRTHNLTIPSKFVSMVSELAELCSRTVELVVQADERLYENFSTCLELIGRVNELESEADHKERELIEAIFTSDLQNMEKLVLRDFVMRLATIADRAENVGDRLRIVVAKRGV